MREPGLDRLAEIMQRLRAEDGCPWDREQTLESLKPFLLEESYEVLEVMADADPDAHREELGDLLFQIVFQAQLRHEAGGFQLMSWTASVTSSRGGTLTCSAVRMWTTLRLSRVAGMS